MRCPEDVPKPTEENPVISAASSGHLSKEEVGKRQGKGKENQRKR